MFILYAHKGLLNTANNREVLKKELQTWRHTPEELLAALKRVLKFPTAEEFYADENNQYEPFQDWDNLLKYSTVEDIVYDINNGYVGGYENYWEAFAAKEPRIAVNATETVYQMAVQLTCRNADNPAGFGCSSWEELYNKCPEELEVRDDLPFAELEAHLPWEMERVEAVFDAVARAVYEQTNDEVVLYAR